MGVATLMEPQYHAADEQWISNPFWLLRLGHSVGIVTDMEPQWWSVSRLGGSRGLRIDYWSLIDMPNKLGLLMGFAVILEPQYGHGLGYARLLVLRLDSAMEVVVRLEPQVSVARAEARGGSGFRWKHGASARFLDGDTWLHWY